MGMIWIIHAFCGIRTSVDKGMTLLFQMRNNARLQCRTGMITTYAHNHITKIPTFQ